LYFIVYFARWWPWQLITIMSQPGVCLAFLGLLVLQVCLLPGVCDGQLTFTPGWRNRVLSKDVSTRADHSGKRAAFWQALQSSHSNLEKRSGATADIFPQIEISNVSQTHYDKEVDRACRLLEAHLARLFLTDNNVRMKKRIS
jgi:hypothetical protein